MQSAALDRGGGEAAGELPAAPPAAQLQLKCPPNIARSTVLKEPWDWGTRRAGGRRSASPVARPLDGQKRRERERGRVCVCVSVSVEREPRYGAPLCMHACLSQACGPDATTRDICLPGQSTAALRWNVPWRRYGNRNAKRETCRLTEYDLFFASVLSYAEVPSACAAAAEYRSCRGLLLSHVAVSKGRPFSA